MYLVVSPHAVLAVLVEETEEGQWPIYYMCRAFHGAEVRYLWTKMLVFTLVVAKSMLRPYVQAHTMKVLTNLPLKKIL